MIGVILLLILSIYCIIDERPYLLLGCIIGIILYFVITGKSYNVTEALKYPPKHLRTEIVDTAKVSRADSIWNSMQDSDKEKVIKFYYDYINE